MAEGDGLEGGPDFLLKRCARSLQGQVEAGSLSRKILLQLSTAAMMTEMKNGSVIIDLAAETGGNVEGSVAGKDSAIKVANGVVTLVGMKDVPSTMAFDASRLYAKNIQNLIQLMTVEGAIVPDFDDEVVAGACLTHDGEIRHEPTREALATSKKEGK